jgi:type VI secretion system secreted protein VgrG
VADYTQKDRPLKIETTLGTDALLLAGIEGEEAISRPFRFALDLASPRLDVDTAALLRTPAAVSFPLQDGSTRTIHGLFNRLSQTGRHEDLATYRAEIVAWPWFLSLRKNRKIFQEKSILEIAAEIFRFWGFSDFDFRCEDRPAKDYVVQYNESDLEFLSRWLETEGIFYFFEHFEDRHVLVLADNNGLVEPCPSIAEAWLRGDTEVEGDAVTSLTLEHAVHVGRVTLRSYDYLQPSLSLEASHEGDGTGEVYDFSGSFSTPEDADRYARYRIEAEEAQREQVEGVGNCRWMVSGHTFELEGHFNPATNGEYIITSVTHRATAGGFRSGDIDGLAYHNTFQCIRSDTPYRPLHRHTKPAPQGTHTAVVVGPAGEEIWTDRYGRVKVQFHWDRDGKHDEASSCWIRVATPWGSKGFGSFSVPRIGDEVVVDFVEGDPDRPVIVGSVYNAARMPPFELPAQQTQAGLRSHSIKGGTGNYSEIRFDDTPGEEKLVVHAEKDHHVVVENNEYHTVQGTALLDYGGVKIKAGNVGVGGGSRALGIGGKVKTPWSKEGPQYGGYIADYGALYSGSALTYNANYGVALSHYGSYTAAYGHYLGVYGAKGDFKGKGYGYTYNEIKGARTRLDAVEKLTRQATTEVRSITTSIGEVQTELSNLGTKIDNIRCLTIQGPFISIG